MPDHEIILYHYPFSPFAKRVTWYLTLRQIPYKQCLQPPTLPRPALTALGTHYRRIPLLSIDSSLYTDTRLILAKLSALYPSSPTHPSITPSSSPSQRALQSLLESWAIDAGFFGRAGQLIPADMPLLRDPKFVRDREDYTGRSWERGAVERGRPEALVDVRGAFGVLEDGLLGDGRRWVGGGEGPDVLDIEAVWIPHWLRGLKGALPSAYISATQFPRTFAWIQRFDAAVKTASLTSPRAPKISAEEALEIVSKGSFPEPGGDVEANDPSGLEKGDEIEVWPIDSGFNHKDRGRLLKLDGKEVVVEGKTERGAVVRIHCPRHGFRVRKVGAAKL